ncbi:MAG TPA: hypothetical protein VKG82_11005 [Solirubrobacteraceae bacterium]|nr:hypothetical protein [Solirubrobacteraceae bacterium]
MFSNTFVGIAPSSVPPYVAAQLVGGVAAIALLRALYPNVTPDEAAEVLLPHSDEAPGLEADTISATTIDARTRAHPE